MAKFSPAAGPATNQNLYGHQIEKLSMTRSEVIMRPSEGLVEMFTDRIEITNPGKPLVQPERFLDYPPRSRNEDLAALMRRIRLCEKQSTGIDKVLDAVSK
jgi:ATP-dependent DNA helicase RecG